MRALHLVKTGYGIGALWALRQMRELVRAGLDVHVVSPPGDMVDRYRAVGVQVHVFDASLPIDQPWRVPSVGAWLRRLAADVAPDVVHSHFVTTTLMARIALRGMRVPRVFQVPGPLHLERATTRIAELALANQQDYWIASCRWTEARYLASGVPRDRVFLSYYGTDVEPIGTLVSLRDELAVPPETRLVGMVGFMYPPKRLLGQRRGLKGHEDFIDAVARCHGRNPGILGVCVGGAWKDGDWYEARVRRFAETRGRDAIRFLGTRTDVGALYANFDVAVHASLSENCGGAVESLLHGVPTIATDVGGLPDVVLPGRTGWLVPPGNPDVLAAAIRQALADRGAALRLASAGRDHVIELFDVRKTAAQVIECYERMIGQRRAWA